MTKVIVGKHVEIPKNAGQPVETRGNLEMLAILLSVASMGDIIGGMSMSLSSSYNPRFKAKDVKKIESLKYSRTPAGYRNLGFYQRRTF